MHAEAIQGFRAHVRYIAAESAVLLVQARQWEPPQQTVPEQRVVLETRGGKLTLMHIFFTAGLRLMSPVAAIMRFIRIVVHCCEMT